MNPSDDSFLNIKSLHKTLAIIKKILIITWKTLKCDFSAILKVKKIRNLIFSRRDIFKFRILINLLTKATRSNAKRITLNFLCHRHERRFLFTASDDSWDMRRFSKNPLIACFFFCGTLARRWFNKFPQCSRSNDANKQAAKNYYFSWKQHLIFIQIAKSFFYCFARYFWGEIKIFLVRLCVMTTSNKFLRVSRYWKKNHGN